MSPPLRRSPPGGGTEAGVPAVCAGGGHLIASSRVLDGGHVFREGVGVLIHRSSHNRIEGCEIAHLGYTGISLGWEWGYATPSGAAHNHVVGNFIHHIGIENGMK